MNQDWDHVLLNFCWWTCEVHLFYEIKRVKRAWINGVCLSVVCEVQTINGKSKFQYCVMCMVWCATVMIMYPLQTCSENIMLIIYMHHYLSFIAFPLPSLITHPLFLSQFSNSFSPLLVFSGFQFMKNERMIKTSDHIIEVSINPWLRLFCILSRGWRRCACSFHKMWKFFFVGMRFMSPK